ncbi:MAG TPA: cyclic-di-AMP receptor [Phototrophicaceae bacterium]|nr:cyclic-di-AMP receptor [Phototrophicaceae bacterium]
MKLIMTIVEKLDVSPLMSALTQQQIRVTHVSSTGGFLDPGKSTLLIGVDDARVSQVMRIVADLAGPHETFLPEPHETVGSYANYEAPSLTGTTGFIVGSFTAFVLNVAQFEQV